MFSEGYFPGRGISRRDKRLEQIQPTRKLKEVVVPFLFAVNVAGSYVLFFRFYLFKHSSRTIYDFYVRSTEFIV